MNLYHGTSDVLSIGNFLLPPNRTKVLREDFRRKSFDVVFLTVSLPSAEMYAKKAAKKYGGHAVVYVAEPRGHYIMNGTECICDFARIVGVQSK